MKNLLYLKDEQLKGFIEKIFVGYRETFNDSKKVLKKYNLGTAHHKALHLISFYDGITITQLLNKLNVTKQSLNRVINDLKKLNYLEFKKDDPGKQIITGTYAEKYDFWDQAYKSWRSYQLDMSTMGELFE